MKTWFTALLICCFSVPSWAGQFKTIKDIEVHYSAFNSTFLTPEIARSYKLKRSSHLAILNISLLDMSQAGKPTTAGKISGIAKNLIGQSRQLNFREIQEGDAIYYLAEFSISEEENISFNIDIDAGNKGKGTLKFTQKFYVEE